jgi:DNA-binding CsgD family transcriptional regulator
MPSKVASELQERLAAVRETTEALERDRSDLMQRLRQSLEMLRAQRGRLAGDRSAGRAELGSPAQRLSASFGLTPRETEVALLLAAGSPNAAISKALNISEHTARHHTRRVLVKLGVHSRARAGAVVLRELGEVMHLLP